MPQPWNGCDDLAKDAALYGHHHQSVKAMAAGTAPIQAAMAVVVDSIPAVAATVPALVVATAVGMRAVPILAAVVLTVVAFALVSKAVAPMSSET